MIRVWSQSISVLFLFSGWMSDMKGEMCQWAPTVMETVMFSAALMVRIVIKLKQFLCVCSAHFQHFHSQTLALTSAARVHVLLFTSHTPSLIVHHVLLSHDV